MMIASLEHNWQLRSQLIVSVSTQNKGVRANQPCKSSDKVTNAQESQYLIKMRKLTGSESQIESATQFNQWNERAKHAHSINSLGRAADSIMFSGQTILTHIAN
jgi:hypothetical protein